MLLSRSTVLATAALMPLLSAPAARGGDAEDLARYDASIKPAARNHWAFQPVKPASPPPVKDSSWVRNPIDAFVLAGLERRGWPPSPAAPPHALLRRLYLDLLGVPPNPEELDAFLKDPTPRALDRVADELLARPEYGERWARHWLDVARYAETNGYERDGPKPSAWRYRDYVIDAFNKDKPFDRFVTEQLAGDELPGADAETRTATTFLRLGTWDDEPANPKVDRYDQLDDVMGVSVTAFLGLTLRCARCHDHKFEPFSQADYYRMLAVFEPLVRPQDGRTELDRPVGSGAEIAAYQRASDRYHAERAEVTRKVEACEAAIRDRLLRQPPKSLPPEAVAAFRAEAGKRTGEQRGLVKKYAAQLAGEARSAATPQERTRLATLERERQALDA